MPVVFFVFGLLIGSFLNVCIYRIPRGETVVYGSSRCPHCHTPLRAPDLVPVFSFLLLKGRCRYCHAPVSWRYPLVETLTGLLFCSAYLVVGWQPMLVKYLVLFSFLVVIAFIDIDQQVIPNRLVLALALWAIGWQIFRPELPWRDALFGSLLGGGILLAVALLSKGGMGGGDIKLMFAAGLVLGGAATALALFLAFVGGALGGGWLLVTGRKQRKEPISFGPFLAFGILVSALWGESIIEFYLIMSGLYRL